MLAELALEFPADRNCGRLFRVRSDKSPSWDTAAHRDPAIVGDAQGLVKVTLRADEVLRLRLNRYAARDLSFLQHLPGDALSELHLSSPVLERGQMRHLACLSGLRVLDLFDAVTAAEDLTFVPALERLVGLRLGNGECQRKLDFPPLTEQSLSYLPEMHRLSQLQLVNMELSESGSAYLSQLRQLSSLGIGGVTDPSFRQGLAALAGLRELELRSADITDDSQLAGLAALEELQRLSIILTPGLTGDFLRYLRGKQHLRALDFISTDMEPGSLPYLRELPRLEELKLACSSLDERSLREIGSITTLQRFSLAGAVTGDALVQLAPCVNMRSLSVEIVGNADRAMFFLPTLENLEDLTLKIADISPHAAEILAELAKLRQLSLEAGQPLGLTWIARLRDLRRLSLNLYRLELVEPESLAFLSELPQLEGLDLWSARLTDAATGVIGTKDTLSTLIIQGTPISSATIRSLGKLVALEYLAPSFTHLEAADLQALLPLTQLRLLSVASVSPDALPLLRLFPHLESFVCRNEAALWFKMAEMLASSTEADIAEAGIPKETRDLMQQLLPQAVPDFTHDDPIFQARLAELREAMPNCTFDVSS